MGRPVQLELFAEVARLGRQFEFDLNDPRRMPKRRVRRARPVFTTIDDCTGDFDDDDEPSWDDHITIQQGMGL